MADSIPFTADLPEKAETLAIAAATGLPADTVVVMLLKFWAWAKKNLRDDALDAGLVRAYFGRLRDEGRFLQAFVASGWLVEQQDAYAIPHPERWIAPRKRKGKSQGKSQAVVERAPRPRDELFDALVEITGACPTSAGSHVGKICALLRKADPPYTPEEVRRLPGVLRSQGWSVPITLPVVGREIGRVRANLSSNLFSGIDAFEDGERT
ncbi:MAG: hypothetical protein KGL39_26930 [Patescibacteria group bacterium]|nr:hypothetical protein [Patescibacteria group bacterium]